MSPSSSTLTRSEVNRGLLDADANSALIGLLVAAHRIGYSNADVEDCEAAIRQLDTFREVLLQPVLSGDERALLRASAPDVPDTDVVDGLLASRVGTAIAAVQVVGDPVCISVRRWRPASLQHQRTALRIRQWAAASDVAELASEPANAREDRSRAQAGAVLAASATLTIADVLPEDPGRLRIEVALNDLYEEVLGALAQDENDGMPHVGVVFDEKYLILRIIGTGGFGTVFEGRDLGLGASVAIKVLHSGDSDSTHHEELRAEARRITKVKHPNIVDWKALNATAEGVPYFVMERLNGESLEALLARERALPAKRATKIMLQVLDALLAAHRSDDEGPILHLDLKPANIFVEPHPDRDGEDWVKVFDFGVGHIGAQPVAQVVADTSAVGGDDTTILVGLADETLRREAAAVGDEDATMARPHISSEAPGNVVRVVCCTPNYAAPEQGAHMLADQEAVALDARCDIYSAGIVAHRMLVGCLPFDGVDDYEEVLRAKLAFDPPPLGELYGSIPRAVSSWVDTSISRFPQDRWQSADQAREALARAIALPGRRRLQLALSALLLLVLVLTVSLLFQPASDFDLLVNVDGMNERIAKQILFMGPSRETAILEPVGVSGLGNRIDDSVQVRCLRRPEADAPEIPWLAVEVTPDGEFEIVADGQGERINSIACLAISEGNDAVRYSETFNVTWLPELHERDFVAEVIESHGRRIDPDGQVLQLLLQAEFDTIAQAAVRDSRGGAAHFSPPGVAVATGTRFTFDLASMNLPEGPAELIMQVRDRANGQLARTVEFTIAPQALSLERAEVVAAPLGEVVVLTPSAPGRLTATFSGIADAHWRLVRTDGTELAAGERLGVSSIDLELPRLVGNEDFEGRVYLAIDDEAYVCRTAPKKRGHDAREWKFLHTVAELDVHVQIETRPNVLQPVAHGDTVFVRKRATRLQVSRANSVPIRMMIHRLVDDGSELISEASLTTKHGESWEAAVDFDPGRHVLEVSCWRVSDAALDRAPDKLVRLELVVDAEPPTLTLRDPQQTSLTALALPPPAVWLMANDRTSPRLQGVVWQVADANGLIVLRGSAASNLPVGEHVSVCPELPADTPDGNYRVTVSAIDAAGNDSEPMYLALTVAAAGPALRPVTPSGTGAWIAEPDGKFLIELNIRDANGVRAAYVDIGTQSHAHVRIPLGLVQSHPVTGGLWRARVAPRPWWGGEDLRISCHTVDGFGNVSLVRIVQGVGSINRLIPENVRISVHGRTVAAMHLVRGNAAGTYVFGGRGDEIENDLFAAAGMRPFNALKVRRSWQLPFERGAIADYYLGVTEVTVDQFTAFLAAADGYQNPNHWPPNSAPDRTRMRDLLARSQSQNPLLPVAGLSWCEAQAFTHWVGLRLPTMVELEFATRGGLRYRPNAYQTERGQPATDATAWLQHATVPWPVAVALDVTSDTGLHGLSSNVPEWTRTPASEQPIHFGGGASTAFSAVAERDLRATRFWIHGPSPGSLAIGFDAAETRQRQRTGGVAGLRCAAFADWLVQRLDRDLPGGVRMEMVAEGEGKR